MRLVIDIPEDRYEYIKKYGGLNWLEKIILKGIPLPKGHGRLIDGNMLLNKWDNMSVGRSEFDQVIMCMPTIIPSDKENEE